MEVKKYLNTEFIGRDFRYLEITDSTNNECKRNQQLSDGTVFMADVQTNGRGRSGKEWYSAKNDGAWFSILLKPDVLPEAVSQLTLVAGLAVCKAIGGQIKYPNDIVMNGKKVCGILAELVSYGDKFNVVCGIGINVNTDSFEGELSDKATSLKLENNMEYKREYIIAKVLNEFEVLYKNFLKNGLHNILDEYKKNCVTLNSEVTVTYQNQTLRGICTDILIDGSIVIDNNTVINSGEVSVRGIYGYV